MLDLYYWPTPNGHKITLLLEELELPFRLHKVNITTGEQHQPDFLAIAPNNRIPALVDHAPADGGGPLSVFESGAILLYLAEKHGKFIPADLRGRKTVLEWLFWQMAGLGPMAGQNHHFCGYAPEPIPYAIDRYVNETRRLYGVLNRRLEGREYIADSYSIADMACYPWTRLYERQRQDLSHFPALAAWMERIQSRPATLRAYAHGDFWKPAAVITDEVRAQLFGAR